MFKDRQDRIVYASIAVLLLGLWIAGAVLEYLSDRQRNDQIQELRSRIEKIEASREPTE